VLVLFDDQLAHIIMLLRCSRDSSHGIASRRSASCRRFADSTFSVKTAEYARHSSPIISKSQRGGGNSRSQRRRWADRRDLTACGRASANSGSRASLAKEHLCGARETQAMRRSVPISHLRAGHEHRPRRSRRSKSDRGRQLGIGLRLKIDQRKLGDRAVPVASAM